MPNSADILKCQKAAGSVLSQISDVSGVSPGKFCDILCQFLGNIDVQTLKAYFRKVPYKYIVPEDGFMAFTLAITDTIDELRKDNPWGERGRKITEQNWAEHGKALLARMDEIHKRAFTLDFQERLKGIDDFLAE